MKLYSMDDTQLCGFANTVKDAVISALDRQGFLSVGSDVLSESITVVACDTPWLGKLWLRIRGKGAKGLAITVLVDVDRCRIELPDPASTGASS